MYTETQLAQLIETVEKEFTTHLNKAEVLAKSENSSASLAKSDDSKPPKKEEKPSEDKEAAPPKEEGSEDKEAAPAPAAEAAPAPADGAAAPMAGHGYDDEDMAHMKQMYASMSKEELMAHHDAIREALDAKMGAQAAPGAPVEKHGMSPAEIKGAMGKSEKPGKSELCDENPELNSKPKDNAKAMNNDAKNGGIEGQAPSGPKGARSEASKDSKNLHDAMSKTERQDRNGGKIEKTPGPKGSPGAKSEASKDQGNLSDMEKSEKTELDLIKSELEAEKAKSAAATEFLTKLVSKISAPKGKAITEIAALEKNEGGSNGDVSNLSKAEVTQVLLRKSQDPNLTKSDRQAINDFYLNGANFNTISHLLK